MNVCVRNSEEFYESLDFQKTIVHAFYNILNSRDKYRTKCSNNIIKMNHSIMKTYLNIHLPLIYPICPHYCEKLWSYAESRGLYLNKRWPKKVEVSDRIIYLTYAIETFFKKCRTEFGKIMKKLKKKNANKKIHLDIVVYSSFSEIERKIICMYKEISNEEDDPKEIVKKIIDLAKKDDKENIGYYGKFGNYVRINAMRFGSSWLNYSSGIDMEEYNLIKKWTPIILDNIMDKIEVLNITVQEGNENSKNSMLGPCKPMIKFIY